MPRGLHWFRNDLRLQDNSALAALVPQVDEWLPVFVLDPRLADPRPRTRFLIDCLARLAAELEKKGIPLVVREGRPEDVLPRLIQETGATRLAFNADITPFARARDERVRHSVEKAGVEVIECQDHTVFGADQVVTQDGRPYLVYTPYRKAWLARFQDERPEPKRAPRLPAPIPGHAAEWPAALDALAAEDDGCDLPTGGADAARRRLDQFLDGPVRHYHEDRDRPDIDGTSRLSAHLRFGTISVRHAYTRADEAARQDRRLREGIRKWQEELVWREFCSQVLESNPRSHRHNLRREYDTLEWNHDPAGFQAWCEGRTGFPIVDAGMRQLRATGWMHNRVRMIVASFLTKDLLIDWREGERFFAHWLVDYDPASNSGGWQWAASTGTDAQPYFRIFNPTSQGQRFDPEGVYVKRWVPELRDVPAKLVHAPHDAGALCMYARPVVDHAERRELALERFKRARAEAEASRSRAGQSASEAGSP